MALRCAGLLLHCLPAAASTATSVFAAASALPPCSHHAMSAAHAVPADFSSLQLRRRVSVPEHLWPAAQAGGGLRQGHEGGAGGWLLGLGGLGADEGYGWVPSPAELPRACLLRHVSAPRPSLPLTPAPSRLCCPCRRCAQVRENVAVHWGVGLNKKVVARFYYPKDSADLRLMIGKRPAGSAAGLGGAPSFLALARACRQPGSGGPDGQLARGRWAVLGGQQRWC